MTTTENLTAIISNQLGYEVYMLAVEHLAKMIEYPAYDDWGNVKWELERAKRVKKSMERHFPALLDEETQKRVNDILDRAESFYKNRCEMEREMLNRRLEYGKTTREDIEMEAL